MSYDVDTATLIAGHRQINKHRGCPKKKLILKDEIAKRARNGDVEAINYANDRGWGVK